MFDPATAYLDEARRSFRGYKRMAEGAMAQLTDDEFFRLIDPDANSVAIIVKHLSGNMSSRFADFLTSDGEKPSRHRDTEFEMNSGSTRSEVMSWWDAGWQILFAAIEPLTAGDLGRTVTIRNEPHTVLQAIHRQTAHYSSHIGQIIFLAKHLKGSAWKSLSIPKGKSEEFNRVPLSQRPPRP